jgi:hypothetical protein
MRMNESKKLRVVLKEAVLLCFLYANYMKDGDGVGRVVKRPFIGRRSAAESDSPSIVSELYYIGRKSEECANHQVMR